MYTAQICMVARASQRRDHAAYTQNYQPYQRGRDRRGRPEMSVVPIPAAATTATIRASQPGSTGCVLSAGGWAFGSLPVGGIPSTPVPLRATDCGLPDALSVIVTLALRLPVAVGVKVTLMVQEAPAASVLELLGHVLVWAKSPALVPVRAMLLMVRDPVPLLVSVTVCAALVALTF